MSAPKPTDRPSRVAAEEGEVLIDGPNGIALSLTPDAAAETSQRLGDAARAMGGKAAPRRRARQRPS
jgi:hypothetical protein